MSILFVNPDSPSSDMMHLCVKIASTVLFSCKEFGVLLTLPSPFSSSRILHLKFTP